LFVDQGPPSAGKQHWGTVGAATAALYLEHVNQFARARTDLRVAYLLRRYAPEQMGLEADVRRGLDGPTVLAAGGPAASFAACAAARVVVTMSSTLGLEAIALGTPALFVNYTGKPDHSVLNGEFQIVAPDAAGFRFAIEEVLAGKRKMSAAAVEPFIWPASPDTVGIVADVIRNAVKSTPGGEG
jgi:hypothetical protein